MAVEIGK